MPTHNGKFPLLLSLTTVSTDVIQTDLGEYWDVFLERCGHRFYYRGKCFGYKIPINEWKDFYRNKLIERSVKSRIMGG